MEYKNTTGKDVKIRLGDRETAAWKTVKVGEVIEIPEHLALRNGLEKVEVEAPTKVEANAKIEDKPEEIIKEEVKDKPIKTDAPATGNKCKIKK